jgi:hypothetical protein
MQCQSDDREDDEGLREGPQEKNGMDDSVIVWQCKKNKTSDRVVCVGLARRFRIIELQ